MWVDAKYCWLLLLILLVPNIPKQCAWVVVICPSPYHYPVPQLAGCVHHFWILPFLVLQNGSPMGLPIQLFFCGLTWFALVCFGLLWLSLPSRDSFGCPGVPGHLRCWEAPVGLYASAVRKHRLSAWISCWWRSSEELPPTTGAALRTSEKGQRVVESAADPSLLQRGVLLHGGSFDPNIFCFRAELRKVIGRRSLWEEKNNFAPETLYSSLMNANRNTLYLVAGKNSPSYNWEK